MDDFGNDIVPICPGAIPTEEFLAWRDQRDVSLAAYGGCGSHFFWYATNQEV